MATSTTSNEVQTLAEQAIAKSALSFQIYLNFALPRDRTARTILPADIAPLHKYISV
jgi:hypothetical protein